MMNSVSFLFTPDKFYETSLAPAAAGLADPARQPATNRIIADADRCCFQYGPRTRPRQQVQSAHPEDRSSSGNGCDHKAPPKANGGRRIPIRSRGAGRRILGWRGEPDTARAADTPTSQGPRPLPLRRRSASRAACWDSRCSRPARAKLRESSLEEARIAANMTANLPAKRALWQVAHHRSDACSH